MQVDVGYSYASVHGQETVRHILEAAWGASPHDHQVVVLGQLPDGFDVLAVTPTGSGKTESIIFLIKILRILAQDREHAHGREFKKNAVVLAVCPTKLLMEDMVSSYRCWCIERPEGYL